MDWFKEEIEKHLKFHNIFKWKNIFIHGSFKKHKKTILQYIDLYDGLVQDDFSDSIDILLCGTKFSLDFLNYVDSLRTKKPIKILDEETFWSYVDIISKAKKGSLIYMTFHTHDFSHVIRNEAFYGGDLEYKKKIPKAIEIYHKLLSTNYYCDTAYQRLCVLYRRNKEYDKELNIINEWLKTIPSKMPKDWNIEGALEDASIRRTKCLSLLEKTKNE